MKRISSLDVLRGIAAFSVAIPHYLTLNSPDWRGAEVVAITAVEVFFVLSGFVLAPQILTMVVGNAAGNLRVFLVRRWMRTIPPYLVALFLISYMTGQFGTLDFVRYAAYVQNLFSQVNRNDYFPVAWSLSVEEWFYVTFAPLLFVLAQLFGRSDRKFAAIIGVCLILVIVGLRSWNGVSDSWDANVRRVTVFRIDSITYGFLLYIGMERFDWARPTGGRQLGLAFALFFVCSGICAAIAYFTTFDNGLSQQAFPYAAAAAGVSAVAFFHKADILFRHKIFRLVGFYLGSISYSVYLFHILVVAMLKPKLASLDLIWQLVIYFSALLALSSAFWLYFEKPILAARPKYGVAGDRQKRFAPLAQARCAFALPKRRGVAPAVALVGFVAAYLCARAWLYNDQIAFYLSVIATSAAILMLAQRTWDQTAPALVTAARTLFVFTVLLPAADSIYRNGQGKALASPAPVNPAYSFQAANGNPEAFSAWWAHYVDEWTKTNGGKSTTEMPDPKGVLPFVPVPNSTGQFFESVIRINNFGFRGPDIDRDKGDRFRIFALGESPTFGPTLHQDEHPWPEVLQSLIDRKLACQRPIEVINAGTEAYSLENNLERVRRDIIPLKPDLVLSYHGYNGFELLDLEPNASRWREPPRRSERPSGLVGELIYRGELAIYRWRTKAPVAPAYAEDAILQSRYANLYRELIRLGRENRFQVVLSNSSMAVMPSSPREVIDFYGRAFPNVDWDIAHNAVHNEMVRKVAASTGVPFIDTTPHLDGVWGEDVFLDLVHFTQKGNDRIAKIMFDGLAPVLREDVSLLCSAR